MTKNQILTIPNCISFCRLLLVAPIAYFLWYEKYWQMGFIIAVGVASDFLDGILARKLNQISEFGKILDPLADKILIGTASIILYFKHQMPLWLVILIVGRDIAILIGGLFYAKRFNYVIPSNLIGKVTANVLAATLISYIFQIPYLREIFSYLAAIFVFLSSASYLKRLLDHIKGKKEIFSNSSQGG